MAKDLGYYLENPSEMPNDPDLVARLEAGESIDDEDAASDSGDGDTGINAPDTSGALHKQPLEASQEGGEEAGQEAAQKDKGSGDSGDTEAGSQPSDEQYVVKTADGKHEIPYDVLANEREQKRQFQQQLQEANERLKRLEQQAEQGRAEQEAQTGSQDDTPVENLDVESLREYAGDEVADAIKAQQEQIRRLNEEVRQRDEREQQERQEAEQRTVQQDIDSVPELATWQSNGSPLWDAAVSADNRLREDPEWSSKPRQERFKEAVRLVKREAGVPEQPSSSQGDKPEDVDKRAEQALEGARESVPRTHSDAGVGGEHPATSEAEKVERMDVTELEEKLNTMSPEEQDAWLASL